MQETDSHSNRREFLKKGLAGAALGLAAWRLDSRRALAEAATTGKPLLNQATLDALIPKNPAQFRAGAQEALGDLKGYIRNHFTLTAAQEKGLTAMTSTDVQKITEALNTALQKNYRLSCTLTPEKVEANVKSMSKSGANVQKIREAAAYEPGWKVGPATVTADASYSQHDGFSGTVQISFDCS